MAWYVVNRTMCMRIWLLSNSSSIFVFHPFLTVQAGAPRHCLSIALALFAIECETFTSNNLLLIIITHARPFAAPRALVQTRCSQPHYIARYCVYVNSVSGQTCVAQSVLTVLRSVHSPKWGGSIEPPEPPLATGLLSSLRLSRVCVCVCLFVVFCHRVHLDPEI